MTAKRFIIASLLVIIIVSMTGCKQPPAVSTLDLITSNETTPSYFEGYTEEEGFRAFQELDSKYLLNHNLDLAAVETFDFILENPTLTKIWNLTIGTYEFYPEYDIVAAHSASAAFDMWYSDQIKNGSEPLSDICLLSYDELLDICENYYSKAPYIYIKIDRDADRSNYSCIYKNEEIICFDIEYLFDMPNMLMPSYLNKNNIAMLVLGYHDMLSGGYDYIYRKIPDADALLTDDMPIIIKDVTESLANLEKDDIIDYFYDFYKNDLTDEAALPDFQSYLKDKCLSYRGYDTIDKFHPVASDTIPQDILDKHVIYASYSYTENPSINYLDFYYYAFGEYSKK